MDEPICVPAGEEHPLLSETICVFIERKEKEITSFLHTLEMLHCLDFQLCDAKLALFV